MGQLLSTAVNDNRPGSKPRRIHRNAPSSGLASRESVQDFEKLVDVRDMLKFGRDVCVANDAVGIDNIQRALGKSVGFAPDPIAPGDFALWIEVRQ